jgi:hypothetical protein
MKFYALLAASAVAFGSAGASAPAHADITYVGDVTAASGLHAYYTATTDAAMGSLTSSDIVSYYLYICLLGRFDEVTNASYVVREGLTASTVAFTTTASGKFSFGNYFTELEPTRGEFTYYLNGVDPSATVITTHFATAVPSASVAPEPATWLLMILGIVGIGQTFREARRKHGFRVRHAVSLV